MKKIVPIVEGDGDIEAVPELLRRILFETYNTYDWEIARPKRADNLSKFRQYSSRYIDYAIGEPDCGAILVLLDLDDGCPRTEALSLTQKIREEYHCNLPVAVVFAHCEYETWFLASLDSIAGNYGLPQGLKYQNPIETKRSVKEWLTEQMPPGTAYSPTHHQIRMTKLIDLQIARERSRSFQRLCHAISQLIDTNGSTGIVTP